MTTVLTSTEIKPLKLYKQGKVRDVYAAGDYFLIIATDRISAFDYVLPGGIPYKGQVLTMLSQFWFNFTREIVRNHLISTCLSEFPKELLPYKNMLFKRAMLVERAQPLAIECVVRGYLAGSGWKEYKEKTTVCGISVLPGLKESAKLPEPIFTPATKADNGHDLNITENEAREIVGKVYDEVKKISLKIYNTAADYALSRGIIIADTKFEFGIKNGRVMLIDELLTPDSSRFWPKEGFAPGKAQQSFDKQFVRDYLEGINWDKCSPPPPLPKDIIEKTSLKYIEAYKKITGEEWPEDSSS